MTYYSNSDNAGQSPRARGLSSLKYSIQSIGRVRDIIFDRGRHQRGDNVADGAEVMGHPATPLHDQGGG